ncbi:branched-chain amino acid ABC transporter permease [Nocardioides hungaricus]
MVTAVVNGLLVGGFYALTALGLSIVFGVLKLINLGHGDLVVGGAYLASVLTLQFDLGPFTALPLVVVGVACLGYLLQKGVLTGLLRRGSDAALVATFGLSLIAQGLFTEWFTSAPRALSSSLSTSGVSVLGVQTRSSYVVSFAVASVLCLAAYLVLHRTRIGAVVRAAAADPGTAELLGIDVRRVYALTFAAAAGIAAASGILLGINFSFSPQAGTQYLLIGIAVVVLGGIGSVLGTVGGALLLGVLQAVAAHQLGGGYRDLVVYLTFFLVLCARPEGLFTRRPGGSAWSTQRRRIAPSVRFRKVGHEH